MTFLKTLTVKNFMSVGNQTQALRLDAEHLTLVLGENLDMGGDASGSRNGTGKTTILNALSYALYGTALTNIKKDNLINKINNKNMLVTLTFEKDGNNYRIERGRKPNVLKFYVNDEEQANNDNDDAQGDSRETQKDFYALFGMKHLMFKHIVGLNTYTEPFLSMRATDQREIIEELLGITLLSEKAELLKLIIKEIKEEIMRETANIEAIKKANEKIELSINSLETKQAAWDNQKGGDIEKLKKAIIELEDLNIDLELENHVLYAAYTEHTAKLKSLNKEKATLESAIIQAQKTRDKYVRELESLSNKKCYACDQHLHDHKHTELTTTATQSLTDAQKYFDKIMGDLELILKEIDVLGALAIPPITYYDTVEQALTHQNSLSTLKTQLFSRSSDANPYEEQINDLRNTALQEIRWDEINELTELKDHQEFLLKLLSNKDSFIRKKIIDQNLAYLNNRLGHYLDRMGLPHLVTFQNDLTVEITQLGQDLDFDNLSRGERNRLILGLSWAFRDVWESLYQGVNLMFVDELVDNGLDAIGVENALSVLKQMGRERNKNIFLISHKDELVGRVNHVLKVIKENGFTTYSNDVEVIE